tara:strand:+ start:342 stop:518 length:177 start_codon:yes stop_codon:yes gene_type:complete
MGLEINYWDCKFADYDESWDGEEETRYYNCSHKDGCGTCNLSNKWHDETAFCKIAEEE